MENKLWLFIGLLGALLVISIAFLQYFKGERVATDTLEESTNTSTISYPAITPTDVVNAFLSWYKNEENKLPKTSHETIDSLTEDFKNQITFLLKNKETIGVDPFSCTKEGIFENFTAHPAQISGTKSTVVVDIQDKDDENSFIVELSLIENAWKINNILCFVKG